MKPRKRSSRRFLLLLKQEGKEVNNMRLIMTTSQKKVLKLAFVTILTELILSFTFGTLDGGLFTGIGLFVGGIIVFVVNFDTELRLSISLGLFFALIGALFIIRSWKQLTKELDE